MVLPGLDLGTRGERRKNDWDWVRVRRETRGTNLIGGNISWDENNALSVCQWRGINAWIEKGTPSVKRKRGLSAPRVYVREYICSL